MFGETTISQVKVLNHPIETTIKIWLFRVPGGSSKFSIHPSDLVGSASCETSEAQVECTACPMQRLNGELECPALGWCLF